MKLAEYQGWLLEGAQVTDSSEPLFLAWVSNPQDLIVGYSGHADRSVAQAEAVTHALEQAHLYPHDHDCSAALAGLLRVYQGLANLTVGGRYRLIGELPDGRLLYEDRHWPSDAPTLTASDTVLLNLDWATPQAGQYFAVTRRHADVHGLPFPITLPSQAKDHSHD